MARLQYLERLFIWDGRKVTDAGAAHLARLKRLEHLHLSEANIGDESLAVFAELPRIKHLSLQGGAYSNQGLAHLAPATQLESLWIGLGDLRITDAGLVHLRNLQRLEELDLQGAPITDAGLAHLQELKRLKMLCLSNTAVKDSKGLQSALPSCRVIH